MGKLERTTIQIRVQTFTKNGFRQGIDIVHIPISQTEEALDVLYKTIELLGKLKNDNMREMQ